MAQGGKWIISPRMTRLLFLLCTLRRSSDSHSKESDSDPAITASNSARLDANFRVMSHECPLVSRMFSLVDANLS